MNDWRVEEEETLSDHRYVTYNIEAEITKRKTKYDIWDFKGTNWEDFDKQLEQMRPRIEESMDKEKIDEQVKKFQKACQAACKKIIRKKIVIKNEGEWWDGECKQKKSEIRRKIREIKEKLHREEEIIHIVEEYKRLKKQYKELIKEKKVKWQCTLIDGIMEDNKWNKIWEIMRRMGVSKGRIVERWEDAEEESKLIREMARVRKYHPEKSREEEEELKAIKHRIETEDWQQDNEGDGDITAEELACAIEGMKMNKATADDRIPNEVMKNIKNIYEKELLSLYNNCWKAGYFPRPWKVAKLCWLKKKSGGRDPLACCRRSEKC